MNAGSGSGILRLLPENSAAIFLQRVIFCGLVWDLA
jgi:hypothetical protein